MQYYRKIFMKGKHYGTLRENMDEKTLKIYIMDNNKKLHWQKEHSR